MLEAVPVEFVLFAGVLAGVAIWSRQALKVAVFGAVLIATYKVAFSPFATGAGAAGLLGHLEHEWVTLANLLLLLLAFALLAKTFEDSGVPALLPRWLPDDWKGGFVLLLLVFVLSAFLDNIAAAMIGGAAARTLFDRKVHVGYVVAIVAAANGGGAGSVVGDTTTSMMWIAGIAPLEIAAAFIGAGVALMLFGVVASRQQQAYSPIRKDEASGARIDWPRLLIVLCILLAAIAANLVVNRRFSAMSASVPFLGLSIWLAIGLTAIWRRPAWRLLPGAFRGALFLLSLVLCATMMPVERLPSASWQTTFGLGALSSVFDNIPLTALAIRQGGYDWGLLAYAVGFGGSMIWFGSSAGVAVATMFPEARNVGLWLRHGWHVALAYVIGFFVMLALLGFHPGVSPKMRAPVNGASVAL
ncbi:MAG: citrate transporter [Pseudomonadota bacterium]|nr:citrate transporter [Pseudomonadota bacterium]